MRVTRTTAWLALLVAGAVLAAGCGSGGGRGDDGGRAARGGRDAPDPRDWDAVLAAARGQTVNWYLWGGSESINRFVDDTYGPALADRYGITLERVPVADTVDAVNQVLAEDAAGVEAGSVDLIWINGENFATLKAPGPAARRLGPGAAQRPTGRLGQPGGGPGLRRGRGRPGEPVVLGAVPARVRHRPDDRGRAAPVLRGAARHGPAPIRAGSPTSPPGPGAFQGTRFVKGALYELSGGPQRVAAVRPGHAGTGGRRRCGPTWRSWRRACGGAASTYPADENELHRLFANDEVDFTITQAAVGPGRPHRRGARPADGEGVRVRRQLHR